MSLPRPFFPGIAAVLLALLAIAPLRAALDYSTPYYFTALAGASSIGSLDGPMAQATYYHPTAIAVDGSGNIYVGDSQNGTIRMISATGTVTTLAGSPLLFGSADGVGSEARFSSTGGIAVDAQGNVYVADTYNCTIRKITPTGVVSTLAGTPQKGGTLDGTGAAARFNNPYGLAIGPTGDLFVADLVTGLIRKVTPAGVVTTFVGGGGVLVDRDGQGAAASFEAPYALAFDGAGNLYATDARAVRKITPDGNVTTLAVAVSPETSSVNDPGANAYLYYLQGIAVDAAGTIYVADAYGAIRKITPGGVVSTLAGDPRRTPSGADGKGAAASVYNPNGLTIDRNGKLYFTETFSNSVRSATTSDGTVTTLSGVSLFAVTGSADGTGPAARFQNARDTAVDAAGNVYVADTDNHTIRKISRGGVVTTLAGLAGQAGFVDDAGAGARFRGPAGLAIDNDGNLFVTDPGNLAIRKVSPAGAVSTLVKGIHGYGLSLDTNGNLFVADPAGRVIYRVTASGTVSTFAGPADFAWPTDTAVDANGNVYIADPLAAVIRKVTPAGAVSVYAGRVANAALNDGPVAEAMFQYPVSLTFDRTGNLYVADLGGPAIRKISASGMVSTLGGGPSAFRHGTAIGRDVLLEAPAGISVGANNLIYFVDGQTIQLGGLALAPTIDTQPQSQTVTAGSSVQFAVTASGAPDLKYQWFFNGSAFNGPTGNTSTLSFTNARDTDAGEYKLVVTNSLGSVTSNTATLKVNAAPSPSPGGSAGGGSGGGGGGGGGGAPSGWFLGLLTVFATTRWLARDRR